MARTNVLHDVEVAHDKTTRGVAGLIELLPQALRSRESIAAARGGYKSGRMELFKQEYAADAAATEALRARVAEVDASRFARMSYEELMRQLTALRKVEGELGDITQKYEAAIAADRNDVDQLRADRRASDSPARRSGVHDD